jgi:ABC-type nitrate/sulfonate/bicarbonate transport system permease component
MSVRGISSAALGLAGLSAVIVVWHLVTSLGLVSKAFLSSPSATLDALLRGLRTGDFVGQLQATVLRMLNGWLLASLVATALGSLIGISETARAYLRPMLAFARSLPASAVVPVAISLVGLGPSMVLGVIVFGSVWPTLLATVQGFASVEPRLRDVARVLHLSRAQFILKVGLPNALPDILAGMRLSLTVALILSVIGEMLSGQEGLGSAILLAARAFRAPDLYAGIALLGLIGFVSSYGLMLVERRATRWRQSVRQ